MGRTMRLGEEESLENGHRDPALVSLSVPL